MSIRGRADSNLIATGRTLKSIAQGDSYEDKLQKSKRDVERLADKIQKEADLLNHERLKEVVGDLTSLKDTLIGGQVKPNDMGKVFQALLESSPLFNPKTGQGRHPPKELPN